MAFITSRFFKNYFLSFLGGTTASWCGIALCFFESIVGGICFFLAIYFVKILHLNLIISGIILSFYGLGRALGGIAGGKVSDYLSPGKISSVSLFIQGFTFLSLPLLHNSYFLMINLFFMGVTSYSFITANTVWVLAQSEQTEEAQLKSINLLYSASNLGIGLAALLIGLLRPENFHYLFYFSGIFLILISVVFTLKAPKNNFGTNQSKCAPIKSNCIIKLTNSNRVILIMLICLFFVSLVVSQLNATYLYYIHTTFSHINFIGISLLFSLNPLLIVFIQVPLLSTVNDKNKILMAGFGALLLGVGMAILGLPSFLWAILSCLVFTFGEMIYFSMVQLVIYQQSRKEGKGEALGLYRMVYALGAILGPTFGSFIYHYLSGPMLWFACGIIGIICFSICAAYKKYDLSEIAQSNSLSSLN